MTKPRGVNLASVVLIITLFSSVNIAFGQAPPQNASPVSNQQSQSIPTQAPTGSVPMQTFPAPVLVQVPTGPNIQQPGPTGFAEQSTDLVVAIAAAVGTVASLALAVLNRMGLFKQKEALTESAKYAITFSNKITEDKEKIRALADAVYQIAPEDKKQVLDQVGIKMEGITKEILATEAQISRLKPSVVAKIGDPRADPDTDPNLPRENTVKTT